MLDSKLIFSNLHIRIFKIFENFIMKYKMILTASLRQSMLRSSRFSINCFSKKPFLVCNADTISISAAIICEFWLSIRRSEKIIVCLLCTVSRLSLSLSLSLSGAWKVLESKFAGKGSRISRYKMFQIKSNKKSVYLK